MPNSNLLEIILITYNRKKNLQNTFERLLASDSPIKDLQITVLDNNSTDGSSDLIQEYCIKYPNIKHIRHNKNIGGNANITRAFEIATKKYLWILCDDDEYNWDNWQEVEVAIENDVDAIVVANYNNPKSSISNLVKQLTFVPAAIYKTSNITDTVLINAAYNISNLFPHLSIVCYLINNNKKIYICDNCSVVMVENVEDASYTRGCDKNVHPYSREILWSVGYINSVQMIKDKKIQNELISNFDLSGLNLLNGLVLLLIQNTSLSSAHSKKNICDVLAGLSFRQRLLFVLAFIFHITVSIYKTKKGIYICLFGKIKTRIYKYKTPLNLAHSINSNEGNIPICQKK